MMRGKTPVSIIIVILVALLVLAGYFVEFPGLAELRDLLLEWGLLLAAVALLVGVANLFTVHWGKVAKGEKGAPYSVVLLAVLVITFAITLYFGPLDSWSLWIYNYIQVPVETSLMAILAVVLVAAVVRMLRQRFNLFSVVFIATGLLMLIGTAPLMGIEIPGLYGPESLRSLLAQIPVVAGARGILLGVSLGVIATGVRILIGSDRPYGG
jgi:hypothetical protein